MIKNKGAIALAKNFSKLINLNTLIIYLRYLKIIFKKIFKIF